MSSGGLRLRPAGNGPRRGGAYRPWPVPSSRKGGPPSAP